MQKILDKQLIEFAKKLPTALYVVGGAVRDYYANQKLNNDIDLCSPIRTEDFLKALAENGIKVVAEYGRTHTVKFMLNGIGYEFSPFRKEAYSGDGTHTPLRVEYTDDIFCDALRRDFKCNAVYYDIKEGKVVDPLNGLSDIKNKVLDTVCKPEKVFCNDGLRLLRLARFHGELGFAPTKEVVTEAKKYAKNILDISPERIFDELKKILIADTKHDYSPKTGHYDALKLLSEIRVLDCILPELTLGRGMKQREDYHKYDVLEHTLRTVLYAPSIVRLPALLHDIGKPRQMINTGKYLMHDVIGEELTKSVLKRLKADNNTIRTCAFLTRYHMLDMDSKMGESKVKRFIVQNFDYFEMLLKLKQADYSASKDDVSVCSTVKKWKKIYNSMLLENTPFTIKDLEISAQNLIDLGYKGEKIGKQLERLLDKAIQNPKINTLEQLTKLSLK